MIGLKQTQIILYVKNMESSLEFYRNGLGLELTYPNDGSFNEHWMTLGAAGTSIALHGGSDGDIGKHAPGLSFVVTDLDAVLNELRTKGLSFSDPINPHPGVVFSTGIDPDGHAITLNQA